ncbi:Casein Kinase 2 substrate [Parasponia andersonii]|uniref:Casein Kinase 2 substrate n=1 Tax=Parasponia andersonii TaxID=3476 RepID=A0A2P5D4L2_PARAD|nr:Casein Kinase 2 substrate [Parasponia andersonii]
MESMIKKFQQRFKKVQREMERWEELQSRLLSQFRNASAIIQRLQVLKDIKNYGSLNCVDGIGDEVLMRQMASLQKILILMNKTLEEFHSITLSLGKIHRDARQMVEGGSNQLCVKKLQLRIGVKPTLADCLDGLMLLHEMHQSEYHLKTSLVSALSVLTLKPNPGDLSALQQLLVDQPNIPIEEVQNIFNIIFAEEIS